ncbi:hypothetical protein ACFY3U_25905 [Micromonospora sp. NPDC000089]|uniref:hypothetical protein n=1 Tax=unclassified Micromonospora TaxID=2617518 RepID=UPI0036BCCAF6
MNHVLELWRQACVPGISGLYRADGSARHVEIDDASLCCFQVGSLFDLDTVLAVEPDNVSEIDESTRVDLPSGGGFLVCGEGAHGSEGFFARLDEREELVWVVFLRDGNPFRKIRLSGSDATFVNNLDRSITINLLDPLYC